MPHHCNHHVYEFPHQGRLHHHGNYQNRHEDHARRFQAHERRHGEHQRDRHPGGELKLVMYGKMRPKKRESRGEDAFFIEKNALGVFDGVGSWKKNGIDSGRYSRKLETLTSDYVRRNGPQYIRCGLKYAHRYNRERGTSTACVASLHDGCLRVLNVGDSGLIVIRDGSIVFETNPQQKAFNRPYQLGWRTGETVGDGDYCKFKIRYGDLIVAGTDGLWDNVFQRDVVHDVLKSMKRTRDCRTKDRVREATHSLSDLAKYKSGKTSGRSPYAENSKRAGDRKQGGKTDDITVVIAKVRAK